ncbi:MAG: hypothetical protein NZ700_09625 [Gemmataceae bacterium]|nr:hypothetical protein [Gemmataceae bacterium]MDW8264164.1 hypothetical protein [Gemmataceae bacterium]
MTITTKADWLSCSDLDALLDFLDGKVSDRKFHLFASACLRRAMHVLPRQYGANVIEVTERFADGLATPEELAAAWSSAELDARVAAGFTPRLLAGVDASVAADAIAWAAARRAAWRSTGEMDPAAWQDVFDARWTAAWEEAWTREREQQILLLHDIVGNPFRKPRPATTWPSEVVEVARAFYHGLPCRHELVKALERIGATYYAQHFDDGVHPKGCWVLDLILHRS